MGNEHHRATIDAQIVLQPTDGGDVEVVGRLIQQQQVRLADQRPRQHHLPADATGTIPDWPVGGQLQVAEHRIHAMAEYPGAMCLNACLQSRKFRQAFRRRSHLLRELVILAQPGAGFAQTLGHRLIDRLVTVRRHFLFEMGDAQSLRAPTLAIVGGRYTGNDAKQCRLASAVAPDQTHPFARLDLEIGVCQQRVQAIGQRYIGEGQQRHRR